MQKGFSAKVRRGGFKEEKETIGDVQQNIRLRKHSGLDKAKVYCAQLVNGHQDSAYGTAQDGAVFTLSEFYFSPSESIFKR